MTTTLPLQKHPWINFLPAPTFDDVPPHELARKGIMVYIAGALAWDYADTVLDLARQMGLRHMRRTTHEITNTRRDYDRMLRLDLDEKTLSTIQDLSLSLEDLAADDFSRLCNALKAELPHSYPDMTDKAEMQLVIAVQMCMTVIDAIRAYSGECDRFVKRYYPGVRHSIMADHFNIITKLIPQYAAGFYDHRSPARALTARILLRHMKSIDLYGDQD